MCHEQPSIEKLQRTGVIVLDDNDKVLNMEEKPSGAERAIGLFHLFIYIRRRIWIRSRHSVENGCGKDAPGNLAHYMVETGRDACLENDSRIDLILVALIRIRRRVRSLGNRIF